MIRTAALPPTPIVPKNLKNLKFMDLDPLEIARQLSLMASNMYVQIKPVECLQKSWSEKPKPGEAFKAENIRSMIENANQLTGWVAETILSEKDVRKRTNVLKHFIMIAEVSSVPWGFLQLRRE
jgi:son of sevenless-like protein